jgi:hypothetical protein
MRADRNAPAAGAGAPAAGSGEATGTVARDASGVERGALLDERDFLLASLEDLERERLAGDIGDADYEELRARYVRRAAEVLRALESSQEPAGRGGEASGDGRPRRRARLVEALARRQVRRVLVAGVVVCFAGLAAILVARVAGVRLPGETASGSVVLSSAQRVRQELLQAAVLADEGELARAVALYDEILVQVPDQPVALAYRGWFERLAGIEAHDPEVVAAGDASIALAARVAPAYADAEGLEGVVLLEDRHDPVGAVAAFHRFLSDHPAPALVAELRPVILAAFEGAHELAPPLSGLRR